MQDLRHRFGITRGTAYKLAKEGKILTVSLRQPGCTRGVRLVSVASVRTYIHRLWADRIIVKGI